MSVESPICTALDPKPPANLVFKLATDTSLTVVSPAKAVVLLVPNCNKDVLPAKAVVLVVPRAKLDVPAPMFDLNVVLSLELMLVLATTAATTCALLN